MNDLRSKLNTSLEGGSSAQEIQNASFTEVAQSYIRYYASGKGHTARAKRLDLQHFIDFLRDYRGYSKPEKIKVRDWDFSAVQRFLEESLQKGESPTTVARRLASIKHMGRILADKIAGFINPAREVKSPKINETVPKALEANEIKRIRRKIKSRIEEKDSFIRHRNQTIFELLLDTGLRADEVRLLRMSQLDPHLEWIENVRTKGRRFRNVYITTAARPILSRYLDMRTEMLKKFYNKLPKAQDEALPLFISTYNAVPGKPETFLMGSKTLWRAINEISADTKLHPHLLRHSYALDLLGESNDVRLVAQALGHSDVRITMRYTQRRDEEVAHALERSRKKKKWE